MPPRLLPVPVASHIANAASVAPHISAAASNAHHAVTAAQSAKSTVAEHSVRFTPGDTIWHEAVKNLESKGNKRPSALQKLNEMNRILFQNHISLAQARDIQVGQAVTI